MQPILDQKSDKSYTKPYQFNLYETILILRCGVGQGIGRINACCNISCFTIKIPESFIMKRRQLLLSIF